MTGPPQAVVAAAVGHRLVAKLQALGRWDGRRWRRLAVPGEDVEHNVSAAGAAGERFGAGRLDRLQPVLQHRREDFDDLTASPSSRPVSRARMRPSAPGSCQPLKGAPIPQRTGLPCQDRHVVPWIAGDLTASKASGGVRQQSRHPGG